jgi:hypothetical protein
VDTQVFGGRREAPPCRAGQALDASAVTTRRMHGCTWPTGVIAGPLAPRERPDTGLSCPRPMLM